MLVTDVRASSFWPGLGAALPAEAQAGATMHAFLNGARVPRSASGGRPDFL